MDVYFHSSTSPASSTGVVTNSNNKKSSIRSFWKIAGIISKHDHRIAPTNEQQIISLKKRAVKYFTAATKPPIQEEEKRQQKDVEPSVPEPSVPEPVLLSAGTSMPTSSSLSTAATSTTKAATAKTQTWTASTTAIDETAINNTSNSLHLEQSSSSTASPNNYRLRKAMAWLGQSFHRFQHSGLLKFQQKRTRMQNTISLPSLVDDHDFHPPLQNSSPASNGRKAFDDIERPSFTYNDSRKSDMEIHIKERDYELDIRVNDVSQTLIRGNLAKITKKISSSKSSSNSIIVPIKEDEQVSLEFVVATQTPKQLLQSITQAIIHHTTANHHTRNNNGKKNSLVAAASTSSSRSPQVVGIARVPHYGTIGKRETRRYKLANPNQVKGWDLDLTVELSYTQAQQQQNSQQQQKKQQPPWTFYTHTSNLTDNDDQDEQCDQETLTQAQTHCHNGDYLTFYVRGKTFPTWERLWVTLQEDRLWLRNFSYKEQREPVDVIPLQHLSRVTKPSLDDQDHVCLGRSHGLVLQMNPEGILRDNNDDDELLEGKVFLFADNATNALHWRRALASYYQPNNNKKKPITNGSKMHAKYVW
ncbi:hypothetical protein INT45_006261 [Circinella minor]|uniref:PH domain-containing protein n=1 Tax=Circinella minor TaxID=1195481 RepID=A0A8H7RWR7_9FUNG|nr:hypothetical protein INT45_006261 [Circinella minor]